MSRMPGPCPDGLFFLLFGGVTQENVSTMQQGPRWPEVPRTPEQRILPVSSNHSFIGSFGSERWTRQGPGLRALRDRPHSALHSELMGKQRRGRAPRQAKGSWERTRNSRAGP